MANIEITSTTTSLVKVTGATPSPQYFPKNTKIVVDGTGGLTFIGQNNQYLSFLTADVTAPAGAWANDAEGLADVLSDTPYFFKSAGGGGSVSPGSAWQLFRTNATATATEWISWLLGKDVGGGDEKELRFVDVLRDTFIRYKPTGSKPKFTIQSKLISNGAGGLLEIETDGTGTKLRGSDSANEAALIIEPGYGGRFTNGAQELGGRPLYFKHVQIDGLLVQDNLLFTNTTALNFIITRIAYFPYIVTGAIGDGTYSMGVTAPNYEDEIIVNAANTTFTDVYATGANPAAKHYIAPTEAFYLKTTVADSTATELKYYVSIEGYYATTF